MHIEPSNDIFVLDDRDAELLDCEEGVFPLDKAKLYWCFAEAALQRVAERRSNLFTSVPHGSQLMREDNRLSREQLELEAIAAGLSPYATIQQ